MSRGWISIHRELHDCWVAEDKPYNYMAAWIDLLLMASHKDTKMLFDGKLIDIERGSFITSMVTLACRWGWSRHKVKNFLDLLVSDNMITYKADNKKTAINVVNYSRFQDVEEEKGQQKNSRRTAKGQQKDIRGTSEGQQKDTINNVEQCINNDKQYNRAFCPPTLDEVEAYCKERNNNVDAERFIDFYSSKGWFVGKNKMKDWKAAVRNWERSEKKSGSDTRTDKEPPIGYKDEATDKIYLGNGKWEYDDHGFWD